MGRVIATKRCEAVALFGARIPVRIFVHCKHIMLIHVDQHLTVRKWLKKYLVGQSEIICRGCFEPFFDS